MVQKEVPEKTLSITTLEKTRVTSPIVSFEEITPRPKRRKSRDNGKEKVGASVWDGASMALTRAHNIATPNDLKELSSIPSHKMVNRHINMLV